MTEYGSIESVQERHTRAGMENTGIESDEALFWFKRYYDDVASLLYELSTRPSQWISVSESLPESHSDVWRYSKEEGVVSDRFVRTSFISDEEKLTTHWQYRVSPQPPGAE